MADYTLETAAPTPVCGIDEAGRGPLAGPVVAAAVILDPSRIPDGLDDSKRLSQPRREQLLDALLNTAEIGIGAASVREIDRLNILQATLLAMARAVAALPRAPAMALVDGNQAPRLACAVTTVVKGDARCLSIAAASIVAKVTRDRLMTALARLHPAYDWHRNAGYPTAAHRQALFDFGPTAHHRTSFAPVRRAIALGQELG